MTNTDNFRDLDLLWNPSDLPASEKAFRELFQKNQNLSGAERLPLIELLSMIARSAAAQNNITDAHKSLDDAAKIIAEHPTDCPTAFRIRWLLERGRLHILEKTPSQAKTLLSDAWELASVSKEDYFSVEIANMMAAIEPQKVQKQWILRAIEIAERSTLLRTKRWLGTLYTSLGWKLFDLRQFEASLEVFQTALKNVKTYGTDRERFVAQWSIGKVLRALGKTSEALASQQALLAELGIGGARDGRLYEELAECLQTLNRASEAQLYFELAYRELSSDVWVTDNQPVKLKRMKDLGKVK